MRLKRTVAPVLLVALFASLLVQLPLAIADRASVYEWFSPVIDIRGILVRRLVEPPDEEAMLRAIIDGMIGALGDPHTEYVPPDDLDEFNKVLRGTYAGIGAEVNLEHGYLVIVSPMDDSPALRAGVMAGDVVLAIEGESTFERPISDSVQRLTGEIGTPVSIRVRHLDSTEEDLTIVRDQIVTRTIKGLRRIGEEWNHCIDEDLGLAYVRITQFNEATVDELRAALDGLLETGLNGLVLDLRDNPGGGLPTAVSMADLFLREGTIVSVRPREEPEQSYAARAEETLPDFPMIVVVNGFSASASEIVAGALQENGRAKVLGTRSFGKGSVQEVQPLKFNAGTLKFTTAYYHLPSGRNLHRRPESATWGVDPDPGFVVSVRDEEYLRMAQARRDFEIIRDAPAGAPSCVGPDWIREHLLDEQLALAVEALRARVSGRPWPRLSEEESSLVAFSTELARARDSRTELLRRLEQTEEHIRTLESSAEQAGRPPLLPEGVDLVEGTLTLRDREGNVVGSYTIDGGDVGMALESIDLRPLPAPPP